MLKRTQDWSDADVDFIIKNYKVMKYSEIATHIGTTTNRVRKKIHAMGLFKEYEGKVWTDEDLKSFRSEVNFCTIKHLSFKYGCPIAEIIKQKRKYERMQEDKKFVRPKAVYSNPDYTKLLDKYAPM